MLKNIELFDKLSLRFNGRVLFIKDVIGDEICCWSFYGQGRKIAEVCCTSIVYATEKKQTKVNMSSVHSSLLMNIHACRALLLKCLFNILWTTLLGGVPWSKDLWGDPEHPPLWVPRWEGSRQCPAGGNRGCCRKIPSSGWGWRARTNWTRS